MAAAVKPSELEVGPWLPMHPRTIAPSHLGRPCMAHGNVFPTRPFDAFHNVARMKRAVMFDPQLLERACDKVEEALIRVVERLVSAATSLTAIDSKV